MSDRGRPLLSLAAGAALAAVSLPALLEAITPTLLGEAPTAAWTLSRASGLVAFALVSVSVASGLWQTAGQGRGPFLLAVHREAAWAGLAFGGLHALVLVFDRHLAPTALEVLLPFGFAGHAPGWVGLGQLALYGGLVVAVSFRLRAKLGARAWRALHYGSFTVFVLALAHGVLAGTDGDRPWVAAGYGVSAATVLVLLFVRAAQARRSAATRRRAPAG